jgi:hypothetical protein
VLAIQVAAAVTYTDEDGDGIDDTFTISAATTLTDASQVAVYFSLADRFNGFGATTALSPRWRVQPITVTSAAAQSRSKGRNNCASSRLNTKAWSTSARTGLTRRRRQLRDHARSVPALHRDRWQHGRTSQAVVIWETRPCHGWWCCCDGCITASYSGAVSRRSGDGAGGRAGGIRDARHGLITPVAELYDTAGKRGHRNQLVRWRAARSRDRALPGRLAAWQRRTDARAVPHCGGAAGRGRACPPGVRVRRANRELYHWQFDLSQTARGDELFGISQENLIIRSAHGAVMFKPGSSSRPTATYRHSSLKELPPCPSQEQT